MLANKCLFVWRCKQSRWINTCDPSLNSMAHQKARTHTTVLFPFGTCKCLWIFQINNSSAALCKGHQVKRHKLISQGGLDVSEFTSPHSNDPMLPKADPPQEVKMMVRSGCQPRRAWDIMEEMSWVMMAAPLLQSSEEPSCQLPWRLPTITYRSVLQEKKSNDKQTRRAHTHSVRSAVNSWGYSIFLKCWLLQY